MPRTIWLAWRYLTVHRIKTIGLVGCMAPRVELPAAVLSFITSVCAPGLLRQWLLFA